MDEPTNHLDIDMIEWLEDYLQHNNMDFANGDSRSLFSKSGLRQYRGNRKSETIQI